MFSSLFQLEQKPVTVFRSSDANAPILTQAAGSLKNLLKACLVEGYGDKPSLGWKIAHQSTDGLTVAFASQDTTASQYCLKVDNSGATKAKLSAAQQMTDIDTLVKPWVTEQDYDLVGCEWMLIGHSKAFVLLLDDYLTYRKEKIAYPLFFGDLPRESKRVTSVCALWTGRKSNFNSGGLQSVLFHNVNGKEYGGYNSSGVGYQESYAVAISSAAGAENLTQNTCRFYFETSLQGTALYEPVLSSLRDSTWTFLPALMPLSSPLPDVGNLGLINATTIKAQTGQNTGVQNAACAVPINWWYA